MSNRVQVLQQVAKDMGASNKLFLQWCRYILHDGNLKYGYRFVWCRDGRLDAARGQARLPSLDVAKELMARAEAEGWGAHSDAEAQ